MKKLMDILRVVFYNSDTKAEIFRYIIVGGFATVIQYLFYLLLLNTIFIKPVEASALSYCISLTCNFFLTSFVTFRSKPNFFKGLGFVLSHMINLGVQSLGTYLFAKVIPDNIAILPAMVISIPINFILIRTIFKSHV